MNSLEKYAAKRRLIGHLIEKLANQPPTRYMNLPGGTVTARAPRIPEGTVQLDTRPQPGFRRNAAVGYQGVLPTGTARTTAAPPAKSPPALSKTDVRPGYRPDLSYLKDRESQTAKTNRLFQLLSRQQPPTTATR